MLVLACMPEPALAGSPSLSGDPVPTPYAHKEFYIFSTCDEGADGKAAQGPATEFNYGLTLNFIVHE